MQNLRRRMPLLRRLLEMKIEEGSDSAISRTIKNPLPVQIGCDQFLDSLG